MCLAIPSRITAVDGDLGTVDVAGVQRTASLLLLEKPQVGDWVIVHAGFAIKRLDEETARESLQCLREAARLLEDEGDGEP
jgi:hydrogenase expression/formation protein HypC